MIAFEKGQQAQKKAQLIAHIEKLRSEYLRKEDDYLAAEKAYKDVWAAYQESKSELKHFDDEE